MNHTGGPAFPTETFQVEGMTLRDYFAAKAMQAMIANETACTIESMTNRAYVFSDAMLKAREA